MAWQVFDKGAGLLDLGRRLKELRDSVVKVGFIAGRGVSNAILTRAAANEFGVPSRRIPQRSFLRRTVDENRAKYVQLMTDAVDAMLAGETVHKALGRVGAIAVGDVRRTITKLREPPNAASTIRKKGSSNPLIDSGRMRQSVTYKVIPARGLR